MKEFLLFLMRTFFPTLANRTVTFEVNGLEEKGVVGAVPIKATKMTLPFALPHAYSQIRVLFFPRKKAAISFD